MAPQYGRSVSRIRQLSRQASTISNASWKSCKSYFSQFSFKRGSYKKSSLHVKEQLTVEVVRSKLLEIIGSQEEIDAEELRRIQYDEWFIERFIIDALNEGVDRRKVTIDSVVETILDCLKWRKESGVNRIMPDSLPKELYACKLIVFGSCKDSSEETMFIRAKMYKKIDEWSQVLVDCICYYFETNYSDRKKRLNIVIDCDGVGYAQADVNLAFKIIPICFKYYPCYVNKVIYYNVPWLLRPLTNLVTNVLPYKYKELIQLADKKTICDKLGGERYLPSFLGGSVESIGMPIPDGAETIEFVGQKRGISQENIVKMREYINDVRSKIT